MNGKQESKLKMMLNTRICLATYESTTATLPNQQEYRTQLDANIDEINMYSQLTVQNSKGITGNKKLLREKLIITTADNSRKMQAFAKHTGDVVLMSEIKFNETQLKAISDIELSEWATLLHKRIEGRLSEVSAYMLTAETQENLINDIMAFTEAIPQPRQSQLEKKEKTLLLGQAFDKADETLSNIDTIVEIVRLSEPTFYNSYKNARKIVESGTGSLQVQGIVIDAATEQHIADAALTFFLEGQTQPVITKQTAAKGGFQIKNMDEGIYTLKVNKVGYQPETRTITISSTELCDIEVKLNKI